MLRKFLESDFGWTYCWIRIINEVGKGGVDFKILLAILKKKCVIGFKYKVKIYGLDMG